MSRLRLLLVWLLMAALPLHGLAAAAMLFCAAGTHHAAARAGVVLADDGSGGAGVSAQHDHSSHDHGAALSPVTDTAGTEGPNLPDAAHECGLCAACCHSVALSELPQLGALAPLPQAEWAEPFVLIHARPAPVPDKPPRA